MKIDGALDIMASIVGNKLVTWGQILDDSVCISLYVDIIGKGMNPSLFSHLTAMDRLVSLTLVGQPV